ncbi:hypothetical protein G3O08_16060 [Cryomorpha ignava]|uniref:DUF4397 domain-containing protein n=1 Tax=Cryomorpha ignava TaxID=101383 RepID=A0A7K3WU53_9FLAO|nr:DUF6567 family protein [Cryomorpha ignava]NEN25016.1 hypothetical protein [Cryomorpha ignava]
MKPFYSLSLITLLCSLLLSSCAFHNGNMTGNASLSTRNFEIKTIVMGTAKTSHVFGIGGLKKQALVYEAKKDLYRSYPLSEGQAFANISVDFKRSYFFIVNTTVATITADVVEFKEGSYDNIQTGFQQLIEYKSDSTAYSSRPFKTDQVVALFEHNTLIPVRIVADINTKKDQYIVEYVDPSNGTLKSIKPDELFIISNNELSDNFKFKIGDEVKASTSGYSIVLAVGIEYLIIKSKFKTYKAKSAFMSKISQ